jgi:hypothetical protein
MEKSKRARKQRGTKSRANVGDSGGNRMKQSAEGIVAKAG